MMRMFDIQNKDTGISYKSIEFLISANKQLIRNTLEKKSIMLLLSKDANFALVITKGSTSKTHGPYLVQVISDDMYIQNGLTCNKLNI